MEYLSVCLSVTFWYCMQRTNAHIIILSAASGKGITLVIQSATAVTKFQTELARRGRYIHGDGKLQFSTKIAVYLENGTRLVPWLLWITNRKS